MADPAHPSAPRPSARRGDTRDPRTARRRALKLLFEADVRGERPDVVLARVGDDARAWSLLDELDEPPATPDVSAAGDTPRPAVAPAGSPAARTRTPPPLDGFTRSLVEGVAAHRERIDALVDRFAHRWRIERMPAVDRNVLRLGVYELAHEATPPAVVISEAVALAKELSTEDSGRFVNGVLESVRRHLAETAADDPDGPSTATGGAAADGA